MQIFQKSTQQHSGEVASYYYMQIHDSNCAGFKIHRRIPESMSEFMVIVELRHFLVEWKQRKYDLRLSELVQNGID